MRHGPNAPSPRAERDFRQMLRSGGVAQPDLVDYAPGEVILRWSERKLAVVVDLESPPASAPFDHAQEPAPSPP